MFFLAEYLGAKLKDVEAEEEAEAEAEAEIKTQIGNATL